MDKEQLKKRLEEIKSRLPAWKPSSNGTPGLATMARNVSDSIIRNVGSVLEGNNLKVSDTQKQSRLNICNECSFFDKEQQRCKKCGCYMAAKTMLTAEKCPIGKW
jgi:hypothetical protein